MALWKLTRCTDQVGAARNNRSGRGVCGEHEILDGGTRLDLNRRMILSIEDGGEVSWEATAGR